MVILMHLEFHQFWHVVSIIYCSSIVLWKISTVDLAWFPQGYLIVIFLYFLSLVKYNPIYVRGKIGLSRFFALKFVMRTKNLLTCKNQGLKINFRKMNFLLPDGNTHWCQSL